MIIINPNEVLAKIQAIKPKAADIKSAAEIEAKYQISQGEPQTIQAKNSMLSAYEKTKGEKTKNIQLLESIGVSIPAWQRLAL